MNKTLKIVLIVVGVLIVLVLVAPFLIPVNEFRPTIEQKASAALGRKVQLGNLSLSLASSTLNMMRRSCVPHPFGVCFFLLGPRLRNRSPRLCDRPTLHSSLSLHMT